MGKSVILKFYSFFFSRAKIHECHIKVIREMLVSEIAYYNNKCLSEIQCHNYFIGAN